MSDMREFLLKLESELDSTDRKLEELEADLSNEQTEAELAGTRYRDGRDALLRTIHDQRDALRARIAQSRAGPESARQESRQALQQAWDELREALRRLIG
jgi:hypothetical protein